MTPGTNFAGVANVVPSPTVAFLERISMGFGDKLIICLLPAESCGL